MAATVFSPRLIGPMAASSRSNASARGRGRARPACPRATGRARAAGRRGPRTAGRSPCTEETEVVAQLVGEEAAEDGVRAGADLRADPADVGGVGHRQHDRRPVVREPAPPGGRLQLREQGEPDRDHHHGGRGVGDPERDGARRDEHAEQEPLRVRADRPHDVERHPAVKAPLLHGGADRHAAEEEEDVRVDERAAARAASPASPRPKTPSSGKSTSGKQAVSATGSTSKSHHSAIHAATAAAYAGRWPKPGTAWSPLGTSAIARAAAGPEATPRQRSMLSRAGGRSASVRGARRRGGGIGGALHGDSIAHAPPPRQSARSAAGAAGALGVRRSAGRSRRPQGQETAVSDPLVVNDALTAPAALLQLERRARVRGPAVRTSTRSPPRWSCASTSARGRSSPMTPRRGCASWRAAGSTPRGGCSS